MGGKIMDILMIILHTIRMSADQEYLQSQCWPLACLIYLWGTP
jgi:hypothetical protein